MNDEAEEARKKVSCRGPSRGPIPEVRAHAACQYFADAGQGPALCSGDGQRDHKYGVSSLTSRQSSAVQLNAHARRSLFP